MSSPMKPDPMKKLDEVKAMKGRKVEKPPENVTTLATQSQGLFHRNILKGDMPYHFLAITITPLYSTSFVFHQTKITTS
jgi:hypothetical protein